MGWKAGIITGCVAVLVGCVRAPDPIDRFAAQAAINRPAAAVAMATAFRAGEATFNDFLDRAHAMLDTGDPGATAFAGAVLDMGVAIEDALPKGGEFEIFWFRVGRLACRSAQAAAEAGRVPEARTLVLAGPERWRTEAYWLRYPDHDGLASMILHATGSTAEAIGRLRDRSVLQGEAAEALELIENRRR